MVLDVLLKWGSAIECCSIAMVIGDEVGALVVNWVLLLWLF